MFNLRDAVDSLDKHLPATTLRSQNFSPLWRQAVIAPPPLPALLHPSALNPTALFQPIEQRIERRRVEAERPSGTLFDQFADVVAVARPNL
jgi:hypothetical protein